MIAAILTARLVAWRTVQTWHALAAGWPALTKNGRARRRRHRAELRRVRAYVRYLAADRAQILENMAQNAAYDEQDRIGTNDPRPTVDTRDARKFATDSAMSDANACPARDSGSYTPVIPRRPLRRRPNPKNRKPPREGTAYGATAKNLRTLLHGSAPNGRAHVIPATVLFCRVLAGVPTHQRNPRNARNINRNHPDRRRPRLGADPRRNCPLGGSALVAWARFAAAGQVDPYDPSRISSTVGLADLDLSRHDRPQRRAPPRIDRATHRRSSPRQAFDVHAHPRRPLGATARRHSSTSTPDRWPPIARCTSLGRLSRHTAIRPSAASPPGWALGFAPYADGSPSSWPAGAVKRRGDYAYDLTPPPPPPQEPPPFLAAKKSKNRAYTSGAREKRTTDHRQRRPRWLEEAKTPFGPECPTTNHPNR
jgi:hypothetical protein